MKELKEAFEARVAEGTDDVYNWMEEHVIIPNHAYYYEKMQPHACLDWEEISWFIDRIKDSDKVWEKLKYFLEQRKQDWVVGIEGGYYVALGAKAEPDFYKAPTYVSKTADDMKKILNCNAFKEHAKWKCAIPVKKAEKEYLECKARQEEEQKLKPQDWVIKLQLHYYHSLESRGLEPDFYKAFVYKNKIMDEMEVIADSDEFGRCMRRAVAYQEAEKEYLERQALEAERQKRWDTLKGIVETSPDTPIIIELKRPACTITTTTTLVLDILRRLDAYDFYIILDKDVVIKK